MAQAYTGRQNKGMGWVLTFKQEDTIDQGFFKQKLLTTINKRRSYYQAEETTAFRVFNGEGDGIGGLIIDYFEGYYVIQWYSEGIYAFKDWVIQVFDELGDYQESTKRNALTRKDSM